MSYKLKDKMTLEDQAQYCAGVEAGVLAAAELSATGDPWDGAAAAASWQALRREIQAERDARDEARFARSAAGVRVGIIDSVHDAASKHFAGVALLASDRNPSRSPYRD